MPELLVIPGVRNLGTVQDTSCEGSVAGWESISRIKARLFRQEGVSHRQLAQKIEVTGGTTYEFRAYIIEKTYSLPVKKLNMTCVVLRGMARKVIISSVAQMVGGIPAHHVMANKRLSAESVVALNPDRDRTSLMVTTTLMTRSFTGSTR